MTSKLQVNAIKNELSATDNITLGSDGSVTLQTGAALGANTLAASGGSSLVGYLPAGTGAVATDVQSKLREKVNAADFAGYDPTGLTESSTAFQNAINSLVDGGVLEFEGTPLIGNIVINTEGVTIKGKSVTKSKLKIKSGTTGITVRQNFVDFEDLEFISQGTKTDGLNTNGVLYEKAVVNSIGFAYLKNVNFKNFSGFGLKVVNAINFVYQKGYVLSNHYGTVFDRDAGGISFGTTVSVDNVYYSSCDTGVLGNRIYRSRFSIIAEACTYGMYMTLGAFTLYRCYFEGNSSRGCYSEDCEIQDLFTYSNNQTTDAVYITFTGAVAAANRGYMKAYKEQFTAKQIAILSQYGIDPLFFASHGTTTNTGLKYGENTVALVRGTNLFNNAAWAANRISELSGWDNTKQGYKISGTTAGDNTYGMKQSVTLSIAKQYVIDLNTSTVSGTGITNIKAGTLVVTNGVPFTPTTDGAQDVKCYGVDSAGTVFECYVHAFTISEVVADFGQVAQSNDRLTREKIGRGVSYAAAAPATGRWMQGEIVYNTAPTAGGFIGWVCTTTGSPGTWKTFGAISV